MRAVIFIPPDVSLDSPYAQERIAYALDRGYQLAAVLRDWDDVNRSLTVNTAQVVIVARSVYAEQTRPSRRPVTNRARFEESTVRILGNCRAGRYTPATPAQRFLDATAERWANEFTDWLIPPPHQD